jgi:acetate---CoA ligase (ADP-forming)
MAVDAGLPGNGAHREAAGHPLHAVFAPRSVAVIGASSDPTKRGYQSIRTLQEAGFRGAILPVNPKGGDILGLPVSTSLETLGQPPELALVCTPAASVPGVLESCAANGVRAAVVLALGFAESGESGELLERAVAAVAARTGLHVVGPNTSGLLRPSFGLNLVGLRDVRPGRIAVLVQSGNVLLATVNELATRHGEGISIAVGMGNQTVVEAADYLEYAALDPDTRAVAMYVEGLRDGRRFVDAARRITQRVPVVLLKGGRTDAGRSAARSHTGALAGEYAVFRAALREAGIVEVGRTDELAAVAVALARQPRARRGKGIAVVSDGGGHATLAADALSDLASPVAKLDAETRHALKTLLGPAAATANPVDLAGAADRDPPVFAEAVRLALGDDGVGGVLVAGLFGGYAVRFDAGIEAAETAAARGMAGAARASARPLVVHSLYAALDTEPLRVLREAGVPVIESLETAARAIAALHEDVTELDSPLPTSAAETHAITGIFETARAEGRDMLLETEARDLAQAFGAPVVHAAPCSSGEEATAAARAFGGRVVVKAVSPAAPHKTEAGAVRIGVRPEDAAAAWAEVRRNVEAWAEQRGIPADIRTVLVAPMLPSPVAEVLVGARRDPGFGPVVALGAGGVRTELDRDISVRLLPATRAALEALLLTTRTGTLMTGFRGGRTAEPGHVADIALAFHRILTACPEVAVIEANPVFALPDKAIAVDVRVTLSGRK